MSFLTYSIRITRVVTLKNPNRNSTSSSFCCIYSCRRCYFTQGSYLGAKDVPEKTIREYTPGCPTTWTGSWITQEMNVSVEPKVPEP